MKKLIALLAVIGFVPYAHAADGADFSHSGSFRLQYQNDMNNDGNSHTADTSGGQNWHQRLRWATDVRAGEKLSGHFTLVHNTDWGMNGGNDQYPSKPVVASAPGTASTDNLIVPNEVYMTWMMSDAWMLRAGRGSLTMADGRFISSNDYEPLSKAYDGALATWDQEMARLGFFAVEGANLTKLGSGKANDMVNFYGFSADFKSLPDFLKAAHLHVIQLKGDEWAATGNDRVDTMRAGLTVSGDMSGVDYRVNYEMVDGETEASGTKTDVSANMIDAEVGYTMAAMMNTRLHFGYHTDTGKKASSNKNENYDGFHYDTHNNAGLMDVFEWGNLSYMRVGFSMMPTDDITVGAEYFMFTQTEKTGSTTAGNNGSSFARTASASDTKDDLGTELDLTVTKKYTNNFNIEARYGMFSPGDEFKSSNKEDAYTQIYLGANLTF